MEHEKPENVEEQFVQMFAGHERDLRTFVRSTGLDWSAADVTDGRVLYEKPDAETERQLKAAKKAAKEAKREAKGEKY